MKVAEKNHLARIDTRLVLSGDLAEAVQRYADKIHGGQKGALVWAIKIALREALVEKGYLPRDPSIPR